MDFYRNVPISGECHQPEQQLTDFPSANLDDLFSAQNTEVDVSLEWLSVFVEDCFSSRGNCLPAPTMDVVQSTSTIPKPSKPSLQFQKPQQQQNQSSLQKKVPGKARSKRKRFTSVDAKNPFTKWSQMTNSDPPLLQQAYWLADSELIVPKEEVRYNHQQEIMEVEVEVVDGDEDQEEEEKVVVEKENLIVGSSIIGQQPRRCTHCLSQRTPQWRAGPLGPKTLCNACGVRYKSGRLLPEYRPAKSPTFVSYLHSNSHKKVMEMRMSIPSEQ